ncbi:hypothetical protein [Pedobacter mucosus]|nr:hypothetical protein [Pedobacter mucosus]
MESNFNANWFRKSRLLLNANEKLAYRFQSGLGGADIATIFG